MITKFRAWDNFNKVMMDLSSSNCIDYGDYFINTKGKLVESGVRNGEFFVEEVDAKVMYFTGLIDKNGTEVFSGDILNIYVNFELRKGIETGEVVWCDDYFTYFCSDWSISDLKNKDSLEFEVVGNVYEKHGC